MGCGQLVSDDDGSMCAKCGAKGGGATVAIGAPESRRWTILTCARLALGINDTSRQDKQLNNFVSRYDMP